MAWFRALFAGFTSGAILAATLATAIAAPDCTCRYKGLDIEEGQIICADLPGGKVLMECGRVLNNTAWKTIQKGCPLSQVDVSSTLESAS